MSDEVSVDTPLCLDRFSEFECELLEGHHLPHRLDVSWDYVAGPFMGVHSKTGRFQWT